MLCVFFILEESMERNELKQQSSFRHIEYAIGHLNNIPVNDPHRFELYQYLAGHIADEMLEMFRKMVDKK